MKDNEYVVLNEEKNKKAKNTFYIIVCIITLLVAIIGASFSYFIASASSSENAINTGSTSFAIDYSDDFSSLMNQDLIPADNNVVFYSAIRQNLASSSAYDAFYSDNDKTGLKNTKCRDDNGNAVCSLFVFSVTNPASSGNSQTLNFQINPSENSFENLHLIVLNLNNDVFGMRGDIDSTDENDFYPNVVDENAVDPNKVDENGKFVKSGVVLDDYLLGQLTFDNYGVESCEYGDNLDSYMVNGENDCVYDLYTTNSGSKTYPLQVTLDPGETQTYGFVLYIKNLNDEYDPDDPTTVISSGDQTAADANKRFTASVVITPSGDTSSKIYGKISQASGNFTG